MRNKVNQAEEQSTILNNDYPYIKTSSFDKDLEQNINEINS